jgi:hypothetical protein
MTKNDQNDVVVNKPMNWQHLIKKNNMQGADEIQDKCVNCGRGVSIDLGVTEIHKNQRVTNLKFKQSTSASVQT